MSSRNLDAGSLPEERHSLFHPSKKVLVNNLFIIQPDKLQEIWEKKQRRDEHNALPRLAKNTNKLLLSADSRFRVDVHTEIKTEQHENPPSVALEGEDPSEPRTLVSSYIQL